MGRVAIEHSPGKERGPRRKYARGRIGLESENRPYFEKNGTSTRFDWISCRRRRLRRGLFWSRTSLFALYEVLRSILKSV